MTYCKPWNSGLQSTDLAVAGRLRRLLNAIEEEVTENVAQGALVRELWDLKVDIIQALRKEGWKVERHDKMGWSIRAPRKWK